MIGKLSKVSTPPTFENVCGTDAPLLIHVSGVADIRERDARRVEIVDDRYAMQIVDGAGVVDDRAGTRSEQDRRRQLVFERHTDRGGRLAGWVLLVDFLYGDQQVLTASVNPGRRTVDEPDHVTRNRVAGHLAGVRDVVEDDEPAFVGLTRLGHKADVGAESVRIVPDRAVPIDVELRRCRSPRESIEYAVRVLGTVFSGRRFGAQRKDRADQNGYATRRVLQSLTTDKRGAVSQR